jgi:hypothetical protein
MLFQRDLFETISHLEYTLTIKQIDFNIPHSRQTPTNPSPIKVKRRFDLDLSQIDRIPPLAPSDGKKAQQQSADPHKLTHNFSEISSIFVSWMARKSIF